MADRTEPVDGAGELTLPTSSSTVPPGAELADPTVRATLPAPERKRRVMRDETDPSDLTRRQRQVLAALRRLHERTGVAPTLREIGDEVGLASASSVVAHVRVLETRGLVERRPGSPRTLRATAL